MTRNSRKHVPGRPSWKTGLRNWRSGLRGWFARQGHLHHRNRLRPLTRTSKDGRTGISGFLKDAGSSFRTTGRSSTVGSSRTAGSSRTVGTCASMPRAMACRHSGPMAERSAGEGRPGGSAVPGSSKSTIVTTCSVRTAGMSICVAAAVNCTRTAHWHARVTRSTAGPPERGVRFLRR